MDTFRESLSSAIAHTPWTSSQSSLELDRLVEYYESTLSTLIDHHAPVKSKVVRSISQVPWYNEEIAEAKRQRRRAERKWRRSKLAPDFLLFKRKKNYATYIINKAKKTFYSDFIETNGSDQGHENVTNA